MMYECKLLCINIYIFIAMQFVPIDRDTHGQTFNEQIMLLSKITLLCSYIHFYF